MIQRLTVVAVVSSGVALALAPRSASAEILLGPRLSLELDETEVALGGEARFHVYSFTADAHLDIRPSFDFYLIDGETIFQFAGDAIFAFDLARSQVSPYALAGLSLIYRSVDTGGLADDSDTDFGVNLGGGARFLTRGAVQPFVELRVTLGDIDPILLSGGVLFRI